MQKLIITLLVVTLTSCKTKYISYKPSEKFRCGPTDSTPVSKALGLTKYDLERESGVLSLDHDVLSLTSRAWLCDHASRTLDMQYYIFSRDKVGLIACDFLLRAANRGVKIRLIIDDATVNSGKREIQMLDSHENIEIKIYNPGVMLEKNPFVRLYKILFKGKELNRRMHIKTLTVDGQVCITGGRNIANEYYSYDERYNFRDRDVLIVGKEVKSVMTNFEQYWSDRRSVAVKELLTKNRKRTEEPGRFDKLHQFACDPANFSTEMRKQIETFPLQLKEEEKLGALRWLTHVRYVADPPGKNEHLPKQEGSVCTDSLFALLRDARSRVDIQTPYIVTTDSGMKLLKELVKKGIKVRVLTNSLGSTDNLEAFSGYQRDREELLSTGIEIYEYRSDAKVRFEIMNKEPQSALSYTPVYGLHSKSMVVDGQITVIGSYNMDPRSVNLNTESVAIIRDKKFADKMTAQFEKEFLPENAWRVTKDFNADKEAGGKKMIKAASRKVIPKRIL